jgi:hypothetical protein
MDFGGFIVWILAALAAVILVPAVVMAARRRSRNTPLLALCLVGLVLFLVAGGWFLRGEFFLGEELVFAAGRGDLPAVRSLLDSGAFVNATFNGRTAMETAKQNGYNDVVALLRQRGARE